MTERIFLQNKYTTWYQKIISNRKNTPFLGYTEEHHIIPKSLGGKNDNENLVRLSAREHFICHLLLVKMVSGQNKFKMISAIHGMRYWKSPNQERDIIINSKIFNKIKELNSKAVSERFLGKAKSKDHKKNLSNANLGKHFHSGEKNPMFGKKQTDKAKKKLSEGLALRNSARRWYNNGVESKFLTETPGGEWKLGRIMKPITSGFKWYNNGFSNTQSKTHPGDGWVLGMLKSI